jgi:uncharacterized protein (DUF488 family)
LHLASFMALTTWTIGHSTRSLDEFLELLRENEIHAIADVRRFPASRRYPHFNEAALQAALSENGIEYLWLPQLGGRRKPAADSPNTAWRNEAFRGYADYLSTDEFAQGLADLMTLAERRRTAIMCAEAVWWRCHRAIISDVLLSRGHRVMHILGPAKTTEHDFTSAARIVGGQLSYAAGDERSLFEETR